MYEIILYVFQVLYSAVLQKGWVIYKAGGAENLAIFLVLLLHEHRHNRRSQNSKTLTVSLMKTRNNFHRRSDRRPYQWYNNMKYHLDQLNLWLNFNRCFLKLQGWLKFHLKYSPNSSGLKTVEQVFGKGFWKRILFLCTPKLHAPILYTHDLNLMWWWSLQEVSIFCLDLLTGKGATLNYLQFFASTLHQLWYCKLCIKVLMANTCGCGFNLAVTTVQQGPGRILHRHFTNLQSSLVTFKNLALYFLHHCVPNFQISTDVGFEALIQ